MRMLLVEDDEVLGDGLKAILTQNYHTVEWVRDAESALPVLATSHVDLIILDLNLPGRTGLEMLESLREEGHSTPVLVVTARTQVSDRILALDGGADDYLVKPFDVDELLARIRALHRRSQGVSLPLLVNGDLVMDPVSCAVTLKGEPVPLYRREFKLLQVLMENLGRVMSRDRLETSIYGWEDEVASNAIEVHIHHLRKKIGSGFIRTVRGVGYMMEADG
jgi:two-component system response regulator QseB